ncbi:MAG: hypothetical protein Q7R47_01840 [Candidatus Diapherotrites archaeon]|nr:hypothetical protein [Candidatus Diapherotrites archaeon]
MARRNRGKGGLSKAVKVYHQERKDKTPLVESVIGINSAISDYLLKKIGLTGDALKKAKMIHAHDIRLATVLAHLDTGNRVPNKMIITVFEKFISDTPAFLGSADPSITPEIRTGLTRLLVTAGKEFETAKNVPPDQLVSADPRFIMNCMKLNEMMFRNAAGKKWGLYSRALQRAGLAVESKRRGKR